MLYCFCNSITRRAVHYGANHESLNTTKCNYKYGGRFIFYLFTGKKKNNKKNINNHKLSNSVSNVPKKATPTVPRKNTVNLYHNPYYGMGYKISSKKDLELPHTFLDGFNITNAIKNRGIDIYKKNLNLDYSFNNNKCSGTI